MDNTFPVLQSLMSKNGMDISIGDGEKKFIVSLPPEYLDGICDGWKSFKDGTQKEEVLFGRNYVGEWPRIKHHKTMSLG